MISYRRLEPRLNFVINKCGRGALALVTGTVLLVPAAAAHAASAAPSTWYVAGGGDDAHSGTALNSAFRSVTRALAEARPGDTVSVLAGKYTPFSVTTPAVTILGAPGAVVVGTPAARDVVYVGAPNVTIRGLDVTGCVPNARPADGFGHGASAGVRVGSGASGVTLDHLKVHDSRGINLQGQPFGCEGIVIAGSAHDTVSNSTVFHNGEGILVDGGGSGTVIKNNSVHDNDVLIVDTPFPRNDDWGAVGIGISDAIGVTVSGNTAYNNNGPSDDWGFDGGAFEIYQSSNVTITHNTAYNNNDVLETGANGSANCNNNVFSNNIVSGRTPASKVKVSAGLILRCAHNMTITANKISNVDWWAFWIYQRTQTGVNGGTIAGLTITGNTVSQRSAQVYSLGIIPNRNSITINHNAYSYRSTFGTVGNQRSMSFARWQAASGFEQAAHS